MPWQQASEQSSGNSQLGRMDEKDKPLKIIPDCAAIIHERSQRSQHKSLLELHKITAENVHRCIESLEWRLNSPNKYQFKDVTSPECYIDILARMYIASNKMRDKFMPTQKRLEEYVSQLTNPDPHRRDACWRHYTKTMFEYFPDPVCHAESRKLVHGLYKRLSVEERTACNLAIRSPVPEVGPPDWARYDKMEPYLKVLFKQVPITPFEDSYNLLLLAHVKSTSETHYGRDATFRRVTALSGSITKDTAHQFVQNCPGCAPRIQKCSKAHEEASLNKESRKTEQRPLPSPSIESTSPPRLGEANASPPRQALDITTHSHQRLNHFSHTISPPPSPRSWYIDLVQDLDPDDPFSNNCEDQEGSNTTTSVQHNLIDQEKNIQSLSLECRNMSDRPQDSFKESMIDPLLFQEDPTALFAQQEFYAIDQDTMFQSPSLESRNMNDQQQANFDDAVIDPILFREDCTALFARQEFHGVDYQPIDYATQRDNLGEEVSYFMSEPLDDLMQDNIWLATQFDDDKELVRSFR